MYNSLQVEQDTVQILQILSLDFSWFNINRKYSDFKNTGSFKTGLSDHHHLIYSVMETFKSEEAKKSIYYDYSNFSFECFKDDFLSSICLEKHDFSDFEKKF